MTVSTSSPPHVDHVGARLGLGTAQLGMPYGLSRPPQSISHAEARDILAMAWDSGIDLLDTAAAYGESETVIAAQRPPSSSFSLITKTIPVGTDQLGGADVTRIVERARESLRQLQVERVMGLLVHEAGDLLAQGGDRLFRSLEDLQADGLVGKLGVSVYDPATLVTVLDRYPLEIVQLPLNVLDQRFARDALLARLAARGIEVHARSVFLQGLLLRSEDHMPDAHAGAAMPVMQFRRMASAAGLDAATAALLYVVRQAGVARVIIGVDGRTSLNANLRAFARARSWIGNLDFSPFAIDDPDIVDPRRWGRLIGIDH